MSIVGGVTYTPSKTIKPVAYNGIRSTGFKGVNVFQSDTVVNKTIIVNQENNCECKKSGGNFWSKLAGIATGIVSALGIGAMIAGLFKKDKTDRTETQQETPTQPQNTQPQDETSTTKTLFGGQLEQVVVTGDASKAKNGVKAFQSNLPENVEDAAAELKQMYSGIISDISLEKHFGKRPRDSSRHRQHILPNSLQQLGGYLLSTEGTIHIFHHLMKNTPENIALDRFAHLVFLFNTFDHRKIKLQRAVQIGIQRTCRKRPRSSLTKGVQVFHDSRRLLHLQNRYLGGRHIIHNQLIPHRHFIMVTQLIDKTAHFACLQTVTPRIVK